MGFAEDLNKLCKAAGDKAEMVVRKTALELQSAMVEMSPVGDPSGWQNPKSAPDGYVGGRFRSNWQCGVDSLNSFTGAAAGDNAISNTKGALDAWTPGASIWLTNSMPYAKRLEFGWSKQAPGGMVRLAVQAYAQAVQQAVKGIK